MCSVVTVLVRRGFSKSLKAYFEVRRKHFEKPMRAMTVTNEARMAVLYNSRP